MWASRKVQREEPVEHDVAPPPISLAQIKWLERTQSSEAEVLKDKAAEVLRLRTIRAGRDALAAIEKAESFESWMRIGAALLIGKQHALRVAGTNRAWGRRYGREFNLWLKAHRFGRLTPSLRSYAIELKEREHDIREWLVDLPEKQRDRLTNPQSILRRWKAARCPDGKSPADLRREARAGWQRFVSCVDRLPPDQSVDLWEVVRARCRFT